MHKPIIGVVPSYNMTNEDNDPYKDIAKVVKMYIREIEKAGGIPIALVSPNSKIYTDICDGYLFPGGMKILPEYYPLMYDALEKHKPLLGICLGCQTIGTFFNVLDDKKKDPDLLDNEIYDKYKISNPYLRRLEDNRMHNHSISYDEEVIENAKHDIYVTSHDTFLYDIYKEDHLRKVSLHSSVIARTPEDVVVAARASDGVIESVEYHKDGNKFLGIMFHPEIMQDNKPFKWLVDNCTKEEN